MTIEITRPEVEALILQRLQSGEFRSAEDLILHALRNFEPESRTGADLVRALQESPYRDLDLEPSREQLPVRDATF